MSQLERMNSHRGALSRLLGAILLLLVAAVAAAVFLIVAGIITADQLWPNWVWSAWFFSFVEDVPRLNRLALGTASLLAGLLSLFVLLRLISPSPRSSSWHMLEADDHGFVIIDSRGIAAIGLQAALSTRGVVDADVRVQGTGTSPVRLRVDVGVYPGANAKRAGEEAKEAVRSAVESLVGIPIRDVIVAVHVLEPEGLVRVLN